MKNKELVKYIASEVRATIECGGGIDTLQEMMADIDFYINDADINSMTEFKKIERLVLMKMGDVKVNL